MLFYLTNRDQSAHPVKIITVRIGENLVPPHKRGICKFGSFGVYANTTMAFAAINDKTINLTGIDSSIWNHVALTYDGSNICLYNT